MLYFQNKYYEYLHVFCFNLNKLKQFNLYQKVYMNFLFGKKEEVQAMAEVLEDGREVMNQEMKKAKYNDYSGPEPMLEVKVRVQPKDESPFESVMKVGMTKSFLLLKGVIVQVKYQKGKSQKVELDDDNQAILERNASILKKE